MLFKLSRWLGCMSGGIRWPRISMPGVTKLTDFFSFHEISAMGLYGSDDNTNMCLRSNLAADRGNRK